MTLQERCALAIINNTHYDDVDGYGILCAMGLSLGLPLPDEIAHIYESESVNMRTLRYFYNNKSRLITYAAIHNNRRVILHAARYRNDASFVSKELSYRGNFDLYKEVIGMHDNFPHICDYTEFRKSASSEIERIREWFSPYTSSRDMFHLIHEGDYNMLKIVLEEAHGVDIDYPVWVLPERVRYDVSMLLIDHGIDIFSRLDIFHLKSIYDSHLSLDEDDVKLCEHIMGIEHIQPDAHTLYMSLKAGNMGLAGKILNTLNPDGADFDTQPALSFAVRSGSIEVVMWALDRFKWDTGMSLTRYTTDIEISKYLISIGFKPSEEAYTDALNGDISDFSAWMEEYHQEYAHDTQYDSDFY